MADADYTNHRGERRVRSFALTGAIVPGGDDYHPDARWVVGVVDLETGQLRSVDLDRLHSWAGAPANVVAPPAWVAAGRRLLDSISEHWHEDAAVEFRDLVEEAEGLGSNCASLPPPGVVP